MSSERLQRILARAGVASRRKSEALILAGRVAVNGATATLGATADPAVDRITLDGQPLPAPRQAAIALNKPAGVLTSVGDPRGRRTVMDLVPRVPGLHPVGRLDYDTEGLLLLTTDGDLTLALTHPRRGVPKTYLAQVTGRVSDEALAALREGVHLDDGWTAPAAAERFAHPAGGSWVRLVIHEGRNRQVRRMLAAVGHPVKRLVREAVGLVTLGDLPPGAWRHLEPAEVDALQANAADEGARTTP